jgi:hypothetical protein
VRTPARGAPVSARWGADVLDRWQRRSELERINGSRLAERYVEAGTRMDEHPDVILRSGPTGGSFVIWLQNAD